MNIILEGPDGGGKSTLAGVMSLALSLPIQAGNGPPRGVGEIERRLAEYLTLDGVIFDRHPAVSQPIYGHLRGETLSAEFLALEERLYQTSPIIIYCRSEDPHRHVVKPGESPAHVETLTRRYAELTRLYDDWSVRRAHLIHRIGDMPWDLVKVMQRVLAP